MKKEEITNLNQEKQKNHNNNDCSTEKDNLLRDVERVTDAIENGSALTRSNNNNNNK